MEAASWCRGSAHLFRASQHELACRPRQLCRNLDQIQVSKQLESFSLEPAVMASFSWSSRHSACSAPEYMENDNFLPGKQLTD